MNTPRFVLAIVSTMSMTAALAQPADLQPRVQTSAPTSTPTPPVQPAAAKTTAPLSSKVPAAHAHSAPGSDSIELSTTQISGNRELPKLLYVVPWRRDALGNFVGRPPNSLVDEALTPVDRAVFQRQNRYYAALQRGSPSARSQPDTTGAPPAAAHPKDER